MPRQPRRQPILTIEQGHFEDYVVDLLGDRYIESLWKQRRRGPRKDRVDGGGEVYWSIVAFALTIFLLALGRIPVRRLDALAIYEAFEHGARVLLLQDFYRYLDEHCEGHLPPGQRRYTSILQTKVGRQTCLEDCESLKSIISSTAPSIVPFIDFSRPVKQEPVEIQLDAEEVSQPIKLYNFINRVKQSELGVIVEYVRHLTSTSHMRQT
jgi:hypothetical protein